MNTLQTYLSSAKSKTADAGLVVMGNEAADLDSMASSIAYGYLCTLQNPDTPALPVMPIPRADFHLRTEAVFVFKEAGINLDDLVFLDEVDLDGLMSGAGLVLVDHNVLAPGLEKFSNKVVGILDHHNDEGLFPEADPRIIQSIGSCTSLVAREFIARGITLSREVAILLCGTILLDTVNLDDKAGRVTDADKEIAAKLLPLCPLSQQEYFDKVQLEKFNVQGLSTNDLLRKDYKEWTLGQIQCGIASALLPLKEWAQMDGALAAGFAAFTKDRGLNLLLSMNAYTDPGFNRDLVIFCQTEEEHDKLLGYLQEKGLDLKPIELAGQKQGETGFVGFFNQGNLGISRKKMQPLLAAFFEENKS